ncbi:Na(+)-translocating NADH-quinone reductase subunit A [Simkania negevensis]|uniref:Na(+)-translocating NADH-quinone reductase subunit A n=1 Tax=Simkania negevensis TaxID=83561 RepID=A0ABS3AUP5_9BACT|nr:Na(+)-translocating NADH-quinone reductase subunit A [Simkania negevensis]
MVDIKIKKGLDLPIKNKPTGSVQQLVRPDVVALNLSCFEELKFKLLAKPGERVKIGQPLVYDKAVEGRNFVSPGSGVIKEVRRGVKRCLLDIVIELDSSDEHHPAVALEPKRASREQLLDQLMKGGLFAHIRSRPCDLLADPKKSPKSIFVKAVETAPFTPPAEMQLEGFEGEFQLGLNALNKLTDGPVHLVHRAGTPCRAFSNAEGVEKHSVSGPHPASNLSIHIHHIDPIYHSDETVWTVSALDVVAIGELLLHGRYHTQRVVSIAGPGFLAEQVGFFYARAGHPVKAMIQSRMSDEGVRFISGDILTGKSVSSEEFLGFYDTTLSSLPENKKRQLLHFFRLGIDKFTATRTYLTGFLNLRQGEYDFTTSLHGEERAFVDEEIYAKVMPLPVPTVDFVKALMAEDYELAEALGLLEVAAEDFALPTFICPSKIEMVDIVQRGLRQYAKETL